MMMNNDGRSDRESKVLITTNSLSAHFMYELSLKKNRYKNPTLKQTPSNVPVKNPTNSQGPSNKTTSNSNLRNNTQRKKVLKSLITLETISYKYNSPLDIIKVRDKAF